MRAVVRVNPTPNAPSTRRPDAMNEKKKCCFPAGSSARPGSDTESLRLVPAQDVEQVVSRVAKLFYMESRAPTSHVLGGVFLREDAIKVAGLGRQLGADVGDNAVG